MAADLLAGMCNGGGRGPGGRGPDDQDQPLNGPPPVAPDALGMDMVAPSTVAVLWHSPPSRLGSATSGTSHWNRPLLRWRLAAWRGWRHERWPQRRPKTKTRGHHHETEAQSGHAPNRRERAPPKKRGHGGAEPRPMALTQKHDARETDPPRWHSLSKGPGLPANSGPARRSRHRPPLRCVLDGREGAAPPGLAAASGRQVNRIPAARFAGAVCAGRVVAISGFDAARLRSVEIASPARAISWDGGGLSLACL